MENEGQTAVEWLIKKLQNREKGIFDGLPHLSLDEIYNQAKEMEKEQKEIEFDKGWSKGWDEAVKEYDKNHQLEHSKTWNNAINAVEKDKWHSFEQYYEQEYGKDNQSI